MSSRRERMVHFSEAARGELIAPNGSKQDDSDARGDASQRLTCRGEDDGLPEMPALAEVEAEFAHRLKRAS